MLTCLILMLAACQSASWVPNERERIPVSTWRPVMPDSVCRNRIKGFTVLDYTVTKEGMVEDVLVIKSEPKGVFEQTAIESISHWRYAPRPHAHRLQQSLPLTWEDCRPEQLGGVQPGVQADRAEKPGPSA